MGRFATAAMLHTRVVQLVKRPAWRCGTLALAVIVATAVLLPVTHLTLLGDDSEPSFLLPRLRRLSDYGGPRAPPGDDTGGSPASTAHAIRARFAALTTARQLLQLASAGGIHVYTPDELAQLGAPPPFSHSGVKSPRWPEEFYMYALEDAIPALIAASPLASATTADSAALIVVPQYATHEAFHCFFYAHGPYDECRTNVSRDVLRPTLAAVHASPRWARFGGADHVFVFPHDDAWALFPGVGREDVGGAYFGYLGVRGPDPERHEADRRGHVIIPPAPVPYTWRSNAALRTKLGVAADPVVIAALAVAAAASSSSSSPSLSLNAYLTLPVPRFPPADGAACLASIHGTGGAAAAAASAATGSGSWFAAGDGRRVRGPFLASFLGTIPTDNRAYSGGVRQDLLSHWGAGQSSRVLVAASHTSDGADAYARILRASVFCFCPGGNVEWSPRIYAAVAAGCIPVLFEVPGFDMLLPFSSIVPWHEFVVTLPATDIPRAEAVLGAIPAEAVCAMRGALAAWAPLLLWGPAPHLPLQFLIGEAWGRFLGTLPDLHELRGNGSGASLKLRERQPDT